MNDRKKRAAAVSAVMAYIRGQEDAQTLQPPVPDAPIRMENLWGVSGRQSQMQLRNLMQLRTFHGLSVR